MRSQIVTRNAYVARRCSCLADGGDLAGPAGSGTSVQGQARLRVQLLRRYHVRNVSFVFIYFVDATELITYAVMRNGNQISAELFLTDGTPQPWRQPLHQPLQLRTGATMQ